MTHVAAGIYDDLEASRERREIARKLICSWFEGKGGNLYELGEAQAYHFVLFCLKS